MSLRRIQLMHILCNGINCIVIHLFIEQLLYIGVHNTISYFLHATIAMLFYACILFRNKCFQKLSTPEQTLYF